MMGELYEELIKTANCLKAVSVNGDYWLIMQACVNSVLKVAKAIKQQEKNANKGEQDAINNNIKP